MATRFRVRELIDASGLSQTEVAQRGRLAYSTVNRLYLEQATQISLRTLDRLADVLGCEPGDLVARERTGKARSRRD